VTVGSADTASRAYAWPVADASDSELLSVFEPVVHFTKGERFYPTDIGSYVARCSLWVHNPDGTEEVLVGTGGLTVDILAQPREHPFGSIEFLRFTDTSGVARSARVLTEAAQLRRKSGERFRPGIGRLARGGFIPRIADALFSISLLLRGTVPAVTAAAAELAYYDLARGDGPYVYYGRVVRQGGWTVLQYWYFYCYNSWRSGYSGVNDHESDWENVLVYLYEEDGRLKPEWTAYASHDFHGDDLRRRWDDREQLELVDGHPVVWAGAGSHASYFQQGEYQASIELPLPSWIRTAGRSLKRLWSQALGRLETPLDPFRIPFVDYARGDGKAIGPTQEHGWSPVVIGDGTPWVVGYRGLWGLYAHDPISGENAPAGPMYERDGSPRPSWYEPLKFAGLDKEPPPPKALGLLAHDISETVAGQARLEQAVETRTSELHAIGLKAGAMEGNPHLKARHRVLSADIARLSQELSALRKEHSENEAMLGALRSKLARLETGWKVDPRAHIRKLARPVPRREMRFNRTAEAWGAFSLSLASLAMVGLLVFKRDQVWIGILVLVGALLLIESILRGHYARTMSNVAGFLAVLASVLLLIHFWLWVIVTGLTGLAILLVAQKLRELRR
jgi:hypothetical protein